MPDEWDGASEWAACLLSPEMPVILLQEDEWESQIVFEATKNIPVKNPTKLHFLDLFKVKKLFVFFKVCLK